jgi:type IV pilus assembly protein PilB
MAMEAALGGCLVLSKLHSASAATAVVDMMLMDRGHRMLNSTLAGVLAQHLVHLNCKFCMREESVDPAVRREMGVADDEVFYSGRGCNQCNHTGYSGEHVVFELLSVTPDMHALIRGGAQVHAIYRQAVSDGMTPAAESALMLARSRRISLAEAHRLLQRTRID